MKRLLLLLGLPAVVSCIGPEYYYPEEWQGYYRKPHAETSMETTEGRTIMHWTTDPSKKERIGFLYTTETKLAGSRGSRESYFITDSIGLKKIGFITAEGTFYRFDRQGRVIEPPVGTYPIIDLGLKVFYGYPLDHQIGVEPIDPYQ